MNCKQFINQILSLCLILIITLTFSMVTLASSDKIVGELFISEKNVNGQSQSVLVNGEIAQSGRSVFTSSKIETPENASAVINLGKVGKLELAPSSSITLSFDENGISGELTSGLITVINSVKPVNIKTIDGNLNNLEDGDSATATGGKAQTGSAASKSSGLLLGIILGGAIVAVIIAATTDNNRIALGGGSTVSTVR